MVDKVYPKAENDPVKIKNEPVTILSLYNAKDEFVMVITSYFYYLNVKNQIRQMKLSGYYFLKTMANGDLKKYIINNNGDIKNDDLFDYIVDEHLSDFFMNNNY